MPETETEIGEYKSVSAELEKYLLGSTSRPAASGIQGFITEADFAAQLGVAISTLQRWRYTRHGPRSVKIARRFYYREDAAETFLDEQLKKAETAAKPRRRGRPRGA